MDALGISWNGLIAQILCLAIWIGAFGAGCGWVAKEKGRNPWFWGVVGLVLNVIALLMLIAVPKKESREI